MSKIVTTEEAKEISKQLKNENKTIVLAGGCFDILHIGHITFLEKAKKEGDILLILLEHDDTIKKMKGHNRPFNTQQDRAKILSSLTDVDYIIPLPSQVDNAFYDNLLIQLKPAIIATTEGDINRSHKERQAELINAKVVDVNPAIYNQSTTKLISILKEI